MHYTRCNYVYIYIYKIFFSTPICLSMFASPGSFSVFVTLSSSIITCKPGFKGRQGGRGCRGAMSLAKWPLEPLNSQNDLQDPWNRLRPSCYVPEPPPFSLYASHFGLRLLWSRGHSLNQEACKSLCGAYGCHAPPPSVGNTALPRGQDTSDSDNIIINAIYSELMI